MGCDCCWVAGTVHVIRLAPTVSPNMLLPSLPCHRLLQALFDLQLASIKALHPTQASVEPQPRLHILAGAFVPLLACVQCLPVCLVCAPVAAACCTACPLLLATAFACSPHYHPLPLLLSPHCPHVYRRAVRAPDCLHAAAARRLPGWAPGYKHRPLEIRR